MIGKRQAKHWTIAGAMATGTFVLVSACQSRNQRSQEDAAAKLSAAESQQIDEYRAEVEVGRNMSGRLLGYYGVIEDEKLTGYVNQVGAYVASYGDYPERRYMFAILKHESVNAFACPGGYILVTMGALRAAQSEAELAAILGHEVVHVGKKHMLDTLKQMNKAELEKRANTSGERAKKDPYIMMRDRPKVQETSAGAALARYLSGSTGAGLNILQAAQAGMTLITEKGLSKELEFEADQEGVKYAIRAGYEPKAMLTYLTRLDTKEGKKLKNLEKTHPSVQQRKKTIEKLLAKMKASDIIGASGKERFDRIKANFPKPEA